MARKYIAMPIGRLETFSDGVIAIVITLMILNIKLPTIPKEASGDRIWHELFELVPSLTAYILSFVTLGVLWVNHHQFFIQLKQVDRKLLWYNLHLLFWMCIVPIPTSFLGQHFQRPEATALYGFSMFMNALAFTFMREYVHKHEHLLIDGISLTLRNKQRAKLRIAAFLYFISIFAGYISPYISLGIFIIIIAAYFMPQNVAVETKE